MIYLGIDPGLSGAFAILSEEQAKVFDTPTIGIIKAGKNRRNYLIEEIISILSEYRIGPGGSCFACFAVLEEQIAFPGQSCVATFSTGRGQGIWEGILGARKIPFVLVRPTDWKKAMLGGRGKDKGSSIIEAVQLFPELTKQLRNKKDHNRAEALLLALYAKRKSQEVSKSGN